MARLRRLLAALCLCALLLGGGWAATRRHPSFSRPGRASPPAAPAALPTGLGPLRLPLPHVALQTGFGWTERAGRPVFQPYIVLTAPAAAGLLAVAAGAVAAVRDDPDTYGLYVEVAHARGWSSIYGECVRVLVAPGRAVLAGEALCTVGGPGGAAFGLLFRGHPVDPLPYLGVAG